MGFFTFTSRAQPVPESQSDLTYDKNYVKNAIRLPSAGNEYENPSFTNHFSNFKIVSNNPFDDENQTHRSHRLSWFFRRREKKKISDMIKPEAQMDEDNSSIPQNNPSEGAKNSLSIRISSQEVASDEDSIIQDSKVEESLGKRRRSSWKSKRRSESTVNHQNHIEYATDKKSGFRSLFTKAKSIDKHQSPVTNSSVYEVQETLTQRYMNNGYKNLIDDLDAIPFDLTVKEDNTLQKKVTKAIQAISPSKKSPIERDLIAETRFSFERQDSPPADFDTWNPYTQAKKDQLKDAISITSSEIELSKKYNVKVGIERRPSRFHSFARKLSFRAKERKPLFVSENQDSIKDDHDKEDGVDQEDSAIRKETLSSLFGPEVSTLSQGEGNQSAKSTSESSSTAADQNSLFGKLYAKTLDATDKKTRTSPAEEDLSGSTKFNSPFNGETGTAEHLENIKSVSDSGRTRSASEVYQRVVANFVTVDPETYESENVSSFLQDFYEPTRPNTRELPRRAVSLATPIANGLQRSNSKPFGSVRKNPFELCSEPKPLTAGEQYLKRVEDDRLELKELSTMIKRDRSHHRKMMNGLLT